MKKLEQENARLVRKLKKADGKAEEATPGRFSLDKQFHGDLEGTSKGEMLTAGTNVKGSAGYVAIEKFSGTLRGRSGPSRSSTAHPHPRRTAADAHGGAGLRHRPAGKAGRQHDDRHHRREALLRAGVHDRGGA